MAARELNIEILRGLSEVIGSFYEKIVPEKVVIQDLFKELNRL